MSTYRNRSSHPIPHTPYFLRVDLADQTRLWTSASALARSGDVPGILRALDASGYLFAEDDRLLTWYGYHFEPGLDRQRCGAHLAFVLLYLSAPDADIANFHFDIEGEC